MTDSPSILHVPIEGGDQYPLVVLNQHSGRIIPPDIDLGIPKEKTILGLSDLFIDDLLRDIPAMGLPVLEQRINRLLIDTNRFIGDVSERQLSHEFRQSVRLFNDHQHGSRLIHQGRGLIPEQFYEDWQPVQIPGNTDLSPEEIEERKRRFYAPFHNALEDVLDTLYEQFGGYLIVDMHSYGRINGAKSDIVIGHLDGRSCRPELTNRMAEILSEHDLSVTSERYLQGGYVCKKYSDPAHGKHVIQVEIARDLLAYPDNFTECNYESLEIMKRVLERLLPEMAKHSLSVLQTPSTTHFAEPDQAPAYEQDMPLAAQ
mgnify:CR=1 FL=1